MKPSLFFFFAWSLGLTANACIWDSDTLSQERHKSPDIAKVILGEKTEPVEPGPLRERIKKLQANPHESDAAWWNELAGAHMRLGEAEQAVALLKPVADRFPDDYGIHANLGTAYHLMGNYAEAEKEIRRDLEINPEAHFGLEKYHLALLQYLIRDSKYQMRHVYVDEFTTSFLQARVPYFFLMSEQQTLSETNSESAKLDELDELEKEYEAVPKTDDYVPGMLLVEMSKLDERPAYRAKWNLAGDTNFLQGVIYMATLNPKQPAAFVMLGIASWQNRDLNLAATAFEKAIALGSPNAEILQRKVRNIRDHITHAQNQKRESYVGSGLVGIILVLVIILLFWLLRTPYSGVFRARP